MQSKTISMAVKIMFTFMTLVYAFSPSLEVEAKTVANLRTELEVLEADAKNVTNKIIYTNEQIKAAEKAISQLYKDIDNMTKEIEATNQEITDLTDNINKKQDEIKRLISFVQLSSSNSIYLDYIAGAESLTDFIYRVSVSQQLLKYNNELIGEMNTMIEENNSKKETLKQQQEKSRTQQQQLYQNLDILGQKKEELYEYNVSLEDEIAIAQEILQMYVNAGCKDNEDIKVCANKYLPPDTRFWRPLDQGYVTSEYGWRVHPITGVYTFHDGVDLSNSNKTSTKVYAAANGKVAATGYHYSMGNYIYIHHNINGQKYTTIYLHLKTGSIRVSPGDVVDKNTVLAIMGTTGSSTAEHVHFSIAKGLRGQDYVSYTTFVKNTVNPRDYVNLPSGRYVYWYDRVKSYN
ncbi:MAG: peptidoglycan DD-metalloendopeptidase family protein [Bacilli bacterium]|jgi:murein DD-endopeptidase MepM/ murein hydrolase activator NlpD